MYAACVINSKGEATYSAPTYISIRFGKHDSSTAESHHYDFLLLFESKGFEPVMKLDVKCKPIVIISADGKSVSDRSISDDFLFVFKVELMKILNIQKH